MKNTTISKLHEGAKSTFNKAKYILPAAALFLTLNNGKINAQTSQQQTAQKVAPASADVISFESALGISIPNNWVSYVSNVIKMMSPNERKFAMNFIANELKTIPAKDKIGYTIVRFGTISDAHTGKITDKAINAYAGEYADYVDRLDQGKIDYTNQWNAESKKIIAQNEDKANQLGDKANQLENKANEISKGNIEMAKENEQGLIKIYKAKPNDPELKQLATETKTFFEKSGYKYSEETAQVFAYLGIK